MESFSSGVSDRTHSADDIPAAAKKVDRAVRSTHHHTMSPSPEELEKRNTVGINAETITNITSTAFPGHHGKEDLAWNISRFENDLKIKFHTNEPLEACFSLIGVDAAIANAFRRILLAEVPTLAIDNCFIMDNGSVIADEVLAHRLGLIPLKGSLTGLQWVKWFIKPNAEAGIEGMERVCGYIIHVLQIDPANQSN